MKEAYLQKRADKFTIIFSHILYILDDINNNSKEKRKNKAVI